MILKYLLLKLFMRILYLNLYDFIIKLHFYLTIPVKIIGLHYFYIK